MTRLIAYHVTAGSIALVLLAILAPMTGLPLAILTAVAAAAAAGYYAPGRDTP